MRRARLGAALVCLASGAACGRTDIVLQTPPDEPVEIELALGEERVVPGTTLRVLFSAVEEDSRCPIDVTCVWEGNAAARLTLTAGDASTEEVVLNTTLEPKDTGWGHVRVALLALMSLPREGRPIEDAEYWVRLQVEAADTS